MTVDEILDAVIAREGGAIITEDPADRGGRTRYGISERAHPEAWVHGPPTLTDAKAIYARQYVAPFAELVDIGIDERIRVALIDDAVLSGVRAAIQTLQLAVGVEPDGVLGPKTIAAAHGEDGQYVLVRLVQRRAHRLARIVEHAPSQAKFLVGWIDRCLSMLG
jgi:lysozyme family protein